MDKKIEELASFLKKGSKIHIKKSQRGSFTSYCGGKVTNECIQRGKNSPDPKIRKKATFAANARTWKHDEGGTISSDKNAAYEPTLEDIVKFATSFETFQDGPYQIPNYKGEMQTLAGFGSANPKIIELASQGKLTRDIALSEVRNNFNKIYNRLSLEVPGFDKLPSGAKLGIADIVYNGSGVDSFKRKSPNLIRAISLYDPSNPESLQAVAKAMSHSKNAGGWLGVRSSARRAMALGEYKWNWPELDKYGRQVNRTQYRGPQDWKASPYYQKYAKGGELIYTPFLQDEEISKDVYTPFIPEITSDYTPSFPVEPVRNYTPIEQAPERTEQKVKTPEFEIKQVTAPKDAVAVSKPSEKMTTNGKIYKSSEKQAFKADIYNTYIKALIKRGLDDITANKFAQRLTTQDILESTWGQSTLSQYYNFGGIKDFRKNSNAAVLSTIEYENGQEKTIKQPFRKFNSLEDYINYKIDLVDKNWNVFKDIPENYFSNITKGSRKYATDPKYAEKLNTLNKQIWN